MLDVLGALGPADSLEQVAGPVANALRTMYGADHCVIGEIQAEMMTAVAVDSDVMTWNIGDRAPLEAIWGDLAPARPVVDVVDDLVLQADLPEFARRALEGGMRSSMRVLIGPPADPLGVVTVGSRQPGRFNEADAKQLAEIVQPMHSRPATSGDGERPNSGRTPGDNHPDPHEAERRWEPPSTSPAVFWPNAAAS